MTASRMEKSDFGSGPLGGNRSNNFNREMTIFDEMHFRRIFRKLSIDNGGVYVTFDEAKSYTVLNLGRSLLSGFREEIWNLCSPNHATKLTSDQFIVAMWLYEQKTLGFDPPDSLDNVMLPQRYAEAVKKLEFPDVVEILKENAEKKSFVNDLEDLAAAEKIPPTVKWNCTLDDQTRYRCIFRELTGNYRDGLVPVWRVKEFFTEQMYLREGFVEIWNLCNLNAAEKLSVEQFIVTMWLVEQKKQGLKLPASLKELELPSTLKKTLAQPNEKKTVYKENELERIQDLEYKFKDLSIELERAVKEPIAYGSSDEKAKQATITASAPERSYYEEIFYGLDNDHDGFVSYTQAKQFLMQSGVLLKVFDRIWMLCDLNFCGRLTEKQFTLFMWLLGQERQGTEPVVALVNLAISEKGVEAAKAPPLEEKKLSDPELQELMQRAHDQITEFIEKSENAITQLQHSKQLYIKLQNLKMDILTILLKCDDSARGLMQIKHELEKSNTAMKSTRAKLVKMKYAKTAAFLRICFEKYFNVGDLVETPFESPSEPNDSTSLKSITALETTHNYPYETDWVNEMIELLESFKKFDSKQTTVDAVHIADTNPFRPTLQRATETEEDDFFATSKSLDFESMSPVTYKLLKSSMEHGTVSSRESLIKAEYFSTPKSYSLCPSNDFDSTSLLSISSTETLIEDQK